MRRECLSFYTTIPFRAIVFLLVVRPRQLPNVREHIVASHHPQRIIIDKHAGGVPRRPGCIGEFVPVDTVLSFPVFAPM
ncbi:MAG: hypothetical protein O7E52_12475 [Candidatus Poribacteria bacterium]|nr:hypothetical protein [Candidatus Poribacteria bacterium]